MNIMVFNVPAETVGALSILNEFYEEVKLNQNQNINWIFVLSRPNLQETDNIKVLRFPWIKKSWLHRLYFDHIMAPNLIKKYKIDKIISFQNIIIPYTKVQQTLYVHNSLPFIDHKFTLTKDSRLWIYQNIIGRNIIKSMRYADKVIVQTKWMREACANKGIDYNKLHVVPPEINIDVKGFFKVNEKVFKTFFYPASGFVYKNHRIIVEACKKMWFEGVKDFKIVFTLKGDENEHISDLYKEIRESQLPIEFVGNLTRDEVFDLYTQAVLLFPSYIETVGLPLLEAKLHKSVIVASDSSFSHEILDGYENVYYFPYNSAEKLAKIMSLFISGSINYRDVSSLSEGNRDDENPSIISLLEDIKSEGGRKL